jgi:hypothetical protein
MRFRAAAYPAGRPLDGSIRLMIGWAGLVW